MQPVKLIKPDKLNFYHYSNGKLLLTAEYLVLFGATALAFPVKYGQDINVLEGESDHCIKWTAREPAGIWFKADITITDFKVISATSAKKAKVLIRILNAARELNLQFLKDYSSLNVVTTTNFPVKWGLGTSSTLINNIASWAGINPFELHKKVSKGSGYDITCAGNDYPVLFRRQEQSSPIVQTTDFDKNFREKLYFVYSGKKIATEKHLVSFLQKKTGLDPVVEKIDGITRQIVQSKDLENFMNLIKRHEKLIGTLLNEIPVQDRLFSDFQGVVKSLGAWGGDFILVASSQSEQYVRQYFEHLGLSEIIPFNKMMIK
jgi:mevalonate kinase